VSCRQSTLRALSHDITFAAAITNGMIATIATIVVVAAVKRGPQQRPGGELRQQLAE